MRPLSQWINSQPRLPPGTLRTASRAALCPPPKQSQGINVARRGNTELPMIQKHWEPESRLIWQAGVPDCPFPMTLMKLLHLSRLLLPSLHHPALLVCFSSSLALHSLGPRLVSPGFFPKLSWAADRFGWGWFVTSSPDSRDWEWTDLFREGKNHPGLYGQPKPISKLGKVQLTFISYKMATLLVSMLSCSF